ncbi:hypothetical protein CYLTODRAFT_357772 [Cylindrobasidium torrendii FP15055 ss-10]|uniref:Fido domain-containing protein n=1 Tax=Cylindrobasidium torrendii FP15055 ss-10 TaxID=1314674 RepID=A0A0D7B3U5_9AGAR|nr:hypothetical protein CYLTODRAFT_357772 [Cylindrobasidium torrendii FP15055 ss-10]
MHTARFLPATLYQRYIPPGQTRSNTRRTVIVDLGTDGTGRRMKTDCCPYQRVDIELDEICERASKLLDDRSVHPFALASWLHVVLAGCHPFNDGNGRVCRLVASIPLIRAGYPMISVPLEHRDAYFRAIKKAHSGSHDALVESFVHGMLETLDKIQNI